MFALDKDYVYLDGIGDIIVEGTLPETATDDEMSKAAVFDVFCNCGEDAKPNTPRQIANGGKLYAFNKMLVRLKRNLENIKANMRDI